MSSHKNPNPTGLKFKKKKYVHIGVSLQSGEGGAGAPGLIGSADQQCHQGPRSFLLLFLPFLSC